jgi:hypothetical protein
MICIDICIHIHIYVYVHIYIYRYQNMLVVELDATGAFTTHNSCPRRNSAKKCNPCRKLPAPATIHVLCDMSFFVFGIEGRESEEEKIARERVERESNRARQS